MGSAHRCRRVVRILNAEGVLRVSGDSRTAIGELMGWWSGLVRRLGWCWLNPSARAVWGALACIRLEEPSVRVRLIECDEPTFPAHQAFGDPRQLDEVNGTDPHHGGGRSCRDCGARRPCSRLAAVAWCSSRVVPAPWAPSQRCKAKGSV